MKEAKLMVIGLDGATFDLIDAFIEAGELPNLERLVSQGTRALLRSTIPPATFPAWTSFATGVNPGKHGIFDFTRMKSKSYGMEFSNSTHRKYPAFWEVLGKLGKRVCVVALPGTYPPEKVNGIMISGFDSPVATGIDASFVYPKELFRELNSKFGRFPFADFQELVIEKGWHDLAFEKLLSGLKRKKDIALHLFKKEKWDLFLFLFGESDTVSHHFWCAFDEASPRFVPELASKHREAIKKIYRELDNAIGELVEVAGDEYHLLIASDHGSGGSGDKIFYINRWLEKEGFLIFRRTGGAFSRNIDSLKKAAMHLIPPRAQEWLLRSPLKQLAANLEAESRFGMIDWEKTQAFSEELNYAPSIRINSKGERPKGIVRESQYQSLCSEIIQKLTELEDPFTKRRIVKRVHPREELYSGPFVPEAPDLVLELELDNGYSYSCLKTSPLENLFPLRKMEKWEHIGAKGRSLNGSHRPEGILILKGEGVRPGFHLEKAEIIDITPTVYYLFGIEIFKDMDGSVLISAFEEEHKGRNRVKHAETAGGFGFKVRERPYSGKEAREVEERLRALGYLE
jgi:predicted AlkP superfamily phosphohydrolase/phosphomutase